MSKDLDYQLKVQKEVVDTLNTQINEREVLLKVIFDLYKQRTELEKENRRLQEQLKEARHTIYCIANTDGSDCKTILETIIRDANLYLEKWGV